MKEARKAITQERPIGTFLSLPTLSRRPITLANCGDNPPTVPSPSRRRTASFGRVEERVPTGDVVLLVEAAAPIRASRHPGTCVLMTCF